MTEEENNLTKAQRWYVADRLAEDRLPDINKCLEDVHPKKTFYSIYVKRLLDILIAAIALFITIPVNLLIGIRTLIDVGTPIFFHQERLGKDGKIFRITKFRNMKDTRDERGELLPPSQRVTKFGKFVRKTSLDELLNFWNILIGDMSVIGPRPLVPEYAHRYNKRHVKRMAVRPGLECPPREKINHVWTWQEQFDNDVWYVENVSFVVDCKMIWQLFKFSIDQKSAAARAVSSRGVFMGYDLNGNAIGLSEVPEQYILEAEEIK